MLWWFGICSGLLTIVAARDPLLLAREAVTRGATAEAIALYRTALAAAPPAAAPASSPAVMAQAATTRYELGGLLLSTALGENEDGTHALTAQERADVREARQLLRAARSLRPASAEIAISLAISLCQPPWPGIAAREEAVRLFKETVAAETGDDGVQLGTKGKRTGQTLTPARFGTVAEMGAEAAMALGDSASALALYTAAAGQGLDPIGAALGIARIYLVTGAPRDAAFVLSRLVRLPVDVGDGKGGRIDAARAFDAHVLVGESRFTLGRRKSAFAAWSSALALAKPAGHASFVRAYGRQRRRPLRSALLSALQSLSQRHLAGERGSTSTSGGGGAADSQSSGAVVQEEKEDEVIAGLMAENMAAAVAAAEETIRDLTEKKLAAAAAEDYDLAKDLKLQAGVLRKELRERREATVLAAENMAAAVAAAEETIRDLTEKKLAAAAAEDYDLAKDLKLQAGVLLKELREMREATVLAAERAAGGGGGGGGGGAGGGAAENAAESAAERNPVTVLRSGPKGGPVSIDFLTPSFLPSFLTN